MKLLQHGVQLDVESSDIIRLRAEYSAILIRKSLKRGIAYEEIIDGGYATKSDTKVQFLSDSKYAYLIRVFSYTCTWSDYIFSLFNDMIIFMHILQHKRKIESTIVEKKSVNDEEQFEKSAADEVEKHSEAANQHGEGEETAANGDGANTIGDQLCNYEWTNLM